MTGPQHPADPAAGLAGDLDRLVDRLRHLPDTRLARGPADAAHRLAQRLADAARGVDGRAWPRPPEPREVPRLGDLASGDLVAVTGADLLRAIRGVPAREPVWVDGARRPLAEALTEVSGRVAALRRDV